MVNGFGGGGNGDRVRVRDANRAADGGSDGERWHRVSIPVTLAIAHPASGDSGDLGHHHAVA